MIICIPTKGRPHTETYKLYLKSGFIVYHFVEPDELDIYNGVVPNVISIQKNSQGIAYVRNFILDWAKKNSYEWILMSDDDVSGFGSIVNGKTIPCNAADVWKEVLEKIDGVEASIIGLNYKQHAWYKNLKNYSFNSNFVEVCSLLHIPSIKFNYRNEFNLKEDRDFCIQAMKYGRGILRFNKMYFSCPSIGTNTGGLYDKYKASEDEKVVFKMVNEWKPFIKPKKNNTGRLDIKFDFKNFCSVYNLKFI